MGRRRRRLWLGGDRLRVQGALRRRHLRLRRRCMRRRALTRLIGWFLVLTASVCAVGSVVGAVTGSAIGLATESGMLRGAGIGAISGAVFSIEVAE